MGRALPVLLLLVVSLPCYVWYHVTVQPAADSGPPPGAPGATPPPYELLDARRPPPLSELAGLPDDDATTLMDERPFRWLQGGAPPPGSPTTPPCAPLVLVLVHTATDHAAHRRLIRETWGSWAASSDMVVRFLVGRPPAPRQREQQRDLDREAALHGDIVQGSFVDAYRNLTYKHAMALKWFATRCPDAAYLLKVDDDVLVNTPALLDFVRGSLSPHGARRLLACDPLHDSAPKRSWRSKWRVSYREYALRRYPTYCAGWAVLYSPDVALALYRELQRHAYFWIDDVLVTGVLAERLGLAHASWGSALLARRDLAPILDGSRPPTFILALWYLVEMDMETQRAVWGRVVEHFGGGPGAELRLPDTSQNREDSNRTTAEWASPRTT